MYYEVEPLQPLGTCRALYAFDGEFANKINPREKFQLFIPGSFFFSFLAATSEGSIPMAEGEELQVIELDQGDGWTRVRRITDSSIWEEGFVPTSYIESTLYA